MRIRPSHTKIHEGDLTPVIDMAFQLIAFFMILINFSQVERTEEIELPKSILAKPPTEPPEFQIRLNVKQNGQVLMAGQLIEKISTLTPYLRREVDNAGRQGIEPGKIKVIVRAHRDVEMTHVNELIRVCKGEKVRLQQFILRVEEKIAYSDRDVFD